MTNEKLISNEEKKTLKVYFNKTKNSFQLCTPAFISRNFNWKGLADAIGSDFESYEVIG